MHEVAANWGVPNWESSQDYQMPPDDDALMRAIAWEFLRRNSGYREWWKEKVEPLIQEDQQGKFFSKYSVDLMIDMENRFGLLGFAPDPTKVPGEAYFLAAGSTRALTLGGELRQIPTTEVIYSFDLTLPLDGQFAKALKDAKSIQQIRSQKGEFIFVESRKVAGERYLLLLRILDAYDAGAKTKEIAGALYPLHMDPIDKLKKDRKCAFKLRDGGYRTLAALSI